MEALSPLTKTVTQRGGMSPELAGFEGRNQEMAELTTAWKGG